MKNWNETGVLEKSFAQVRLCSQFPLNWMVKSDEISSSKSSLTYWLDIKIPLSSSLSSLSQSWSSRSFSSFRALLELLLFLFLFPKPSMLMSGRIIPFSRPRRRRRRWIWRRQRWSLHWPRKSRWPWPACHVAPILWRLSRLPFASRFFWSAA